MAESYPAYLERIVMDPDILVGKPTIRGTRISVELVLKHVFQDLDLTSLFAAYPWLTVEDAKACLEYAHELVAKKRSRRAGGAARIARCPALLLD